jgi:formyl-CoA transferase
MTGVKPALMGNRAVSLVPTADLFKTGDGYILLAVNFERQNVALMKALGRSELLSDPRFADVPSLMANMPALSAIFDEAFAAQPMAHWNEVLGAVRVTFGAVRGPKEVIQDPQLAANGIVVPLEGAGGKLTSTISSPIQVHGVTKTPARRGPGLGEHTDEILRELGFDAAAIDGLRAGGAVQKPHDKAA